MARTEHFLGVRAADVEPAAAFTAFDQLRQQMAVRRSGSGSTHLELAVLDTPMGVTHPILRQDLLRASERCVVDDAQIRQMPAILLRLFRRTLLLKHLT